MIGLMLWMNALTMFAFCPEPVPKACSRYFTSDAVFVGTVLSKKYVERDEYLRFEVRVSRVLRGSVSRTVAVYTGNDSARLLWDVGKEYVVFAWRDQARLYSGNDCGPLSDPTKVMETTRQLEALRHSVDTFVEGEVLKTLPDGPGVPGVDIHIRGAGKTYQVKSDREGRFLLKVAPGRYRVEVDPRIARQSDYNIGTDPNNIVW